MMPTCSAALIACQRPSSIIACFRSSDELVSVTSRSAPFALGLAGSRACLESKVAVFDGAYLDVRVPVNHKCVPLTVRRLDDCARSGRVDGPAAVPSVMRRVAVLGDATPLDCVMLACASEMT